MFEVYYFARADASKDAALTRRVENLGGHLSYREDSEEKGLESVCLTFEFERLDQADAAAELLRISGEYVGGPADYAPERDAAAAKHLA
jgi:hypothetical protein